MNPYNFIYENFTYNVNTLSINNFNLGVNNKTLFEEASLTINYGQRYCLIGKNGYGKTSLLKQFKSLCNDDKLKILYVEQELILDERTPLQFIFDSNIKLKHYQDRVNMLQEKFNVSETYNEEEYNELVEAQTCLDSFNPDKEEALINKILIGLGFTQEMLETPSNLFSGGWQMRLSLARSLYLEPDLLLLDEPTNHLDLEAIIWLADYLQSWKKIALIVSHNIGFINNVCTYILNIENKKLISYRGNYNKFKSAFNKKLIEMKKEYEKFDKKLKEQKKKGLTGDKLSEFIKKNQVIRPEKDYDVKIEFFETRKYSTNVIKLDNVSFSYDGKQKILDNISVGISMDSRITLVGLNGCGKSTLIKLIKGEIKPNNGEINILNGIKVGYYNQHFDQQLPFDKTPIDFLLDYVPSNDIIGKNILKHELVRSYLGKIKLEPQAHNKLIGELSGGQKARVSFVKLIFERPQILLLDEPTNHLDIETVETLIESLETFKGGILLITHEPEMIEKLSNQIWMLDNKTHTIKNIESYDKYCEIILE